MARITVEDCLQNVDNRFQLVLVATKRARQLALGAESLVPMDNDKPTVVALREIADGLIDASILDEPGFGAEAAFPSLDRDGEAGDGDETDELNLTAINDEDGDPRADTGATD